MKFTKLSNILLLTMSSVILASCSNSTSHSSDALIQYSNKKVTIEDAYTLAMKQNLIQQPLHDVVIADVFSQLYGDKVNDKEIDEKFNADKSQYQSEDEFNAALKTAGLTQESYKSQLKSTLAYQEGLLELLNVTDKNLEETFKTYTPEATIKLAVFVDESVAQTFLNSVKNQSDFASKAKELNSLAQTDDNSELKFDSGTGALPEDILKTVYSLKDGEFSNVLSYKDETSDISLYVVVQMIKSPNKDNDWTKYKDRLIEIYQKQQLNDVDVVNSLEKKALKKANFKINDEQLKDIFNDELNAK